MAKEIVLLEKGLPLLVDLRGLPIVKPNDVILIRNLKGEQMGPLIVEHMDSVAIYYREPFDEFEVYSLDGSARWFEREKWAIKLVGRHEEEATCSVCGLLLEICRGTHTSETASRMDADGTL